MPSTAFVIGCCVERVALSAPRGQDILAAGRRGVIIVDDDDDAVMLVIDGVADAGGQAVMPEATVADERDRLLGRGYVKGRSRRRAQTIAHGRGADIERRQDREQVAADIGGDMMRPEFLLDQLHGGEDRALRAADTETRRARRHDAGERLDARIVGDRRHVRRAAGIGQHGRQRGGEKVAHALKHHIGRVFAGHRQHVLAE
jgi:hypothetical protein